MDISLMELPPTISSDAYTAERRAGLTAPLRPLVDLSILHHERNPLHGRDVLQRVARDGDDVGQFARLDRSDLVPHVEQLRGVACGGLDGLHRGHAEASLVFEFL